MPKKETPGDRKLYKEPSWALEYLKGVERSVIEKGHKKLGTFRDLRPFYLSEEEANQLRDEVHQAMPSLRNSGLTLKQKVRLLRVREKNRARKQEGKTKESVGRGRGTLWGRTLKQEGKARRRVR